LFLRRSLNPTIIGDYAMTYFPEFTPLPETDLAALRDLYVARSDHYGGDLPEVPTARELMAVQNKAGEAERVERIAEIIPGVSRDACSRMTPVRWPEGYVATAFVTPIQFNDAPYSALIYYDWNQAETLLILPFQGNPPALQGVISLKKGFRYRMRLHPKGNGTCAAVLPGMVRPDWMTAASFECQGVIHQNPQLSPGGDSQILSCPIKAQGQRTMWSWYTANGQPIMFTEAMPEGGGVMLADYHDWLPGETAWPTDFKLPNTCNAPANAGGLGPGGAGATFSNVSCSDCHTTPW
jgi:hypothetical protein